MVKSWLFKVQNKDCKKGEDTNENVQVENDQIEDREKALCLYMSLSTKRCKIKNPSRKWNWGYIFTDIFKM